MLIITSDKNVTTNCAAEYFGINTSEKAIRVLVTGLTGKKLENAIKKYMRSNEIRISIGDEVLFMEENIKH